MPIRLAPEPGTTLATKRVTPEALDPAEEWVDILVYLDSRVIAAAREAGRKTIVQGTRTREEFDQEAYISALLTAQVKGWQLFDEHNAPLPFSAPALARLPFDLRAFLSEAIHACGGIIPTETLVLQTGTPQTFHYKSPDDRVGAEHEPEVPDPKRDPVVRQTVASHRAARGG